MKYFLKEDIILHWLVSHVFFLEIDEEYSREARMHIYSEWEIS